MGTLELKNLSKSFGDTKVIENLNLKINDGERVVFLGPSGCGKSTILRMISGIESVSEGQICFDETDVTNYAPGERDIAMVFQNYALYPHMSVEKNITYALKRNKIPQEDIKQRLEQALSILDLTHLKERKPSELSGGQRQRVALGRAVVKNASYFLLDEPLSNLDALLRVSARRELLHLHEVYKHTFIFVTHDQLEAMALADRIALFDKGEIQMFDTPENIYNHPRNVFTARFIGAPPMNILDATYESNQLVFDSELSIDTQALNQQNLAQYDGHFLLVGIRPEAIHITEEATALKFEIEDIENLGECYSLIGKLNQQTLTVKSYKKPEQSVVNIKFDMSKVILFDPNTEINIEER
ncbi:MAG TPA: ABC transporter ATP-binding protein [Staphylococcus sp.]|nr:ABC transporter ATP-binding protein [Staphylococcus sp.]